MKRTVLTAALRLAFAGSLALAPQLLQAQQPQSAPTPQDPQAAQIPHAGHRGGPHHGPRDPHREAMMLSHRLNLSPDQTAKVEPILADRQQKMTALHANTALTPQDMHQQMRALHEQEKTQLDAVLTPEQQEQLKSMHHGHRGQFRGQGQPGAPSTPGL